MEDFTRAEKIILLDKVRECMYDNLGNAKPDTAEGKEKLQIATNFAIIGNFILADL